MEREKSVSSVLNGFLVKISMWNLNVKSFCEVLDIPFVWVRLPAQSAPETPAEEPCVCFHVTLSSRFNSPM